MKLLITLFKAARTPRLPSLSGSLNNQIIALQKWLNEIITIKQTLAQVKEEQGIEYDNDSNDIFLAEHLLGLLCDPKLNITDKWVFFTKECEGIYNDETTMISLNPERLSTFQKELASFYEVRKIESMQVKNILAKVENTLGENQVDSSLYFNKKAFGDAEKTIRVALNQIKKSQLSYYSNPVYEKELSEFLKILQELRTSTKFSSPTAYSIPQIAEEIAKVILKIKDSTTKNPPEELELNGITLKTKMDF